MFGAGSGDVTAGKIKRRIYLRLDVARGGVKRIPFVATWARIDSKTGMNHPSKQSMLPIRPRPDTRPAVRRRDETR